MDNHPIPQDITGFKFKLIGDMTVKQFAYLGAGLGLAWITFILPITFLITFPLGFLIGVFGVALAFMPFEGRPLDLMISNLAKALFKPTQFIYQKTGGQIYISTHHPLVLKQQSGQTSTGQTSSPSLSGDKLKEYLASLPKITHDKLDEKEALFFQTLTNMSAPTMAPVVQAKPISTASSPHIFSMQAAQPHDFKKGEKSKEQQTLDDVIKEAGYSSLPNEDHIKKETKDIEKELREAKTQESLKSKTLEYDSAHKKVLELEKTLHETLSQKQDLENRLVSIQRQSENQNQSKQEIFSPSLAVPKTTVNVRKVPQDLKKSTGVPITPEYPNLISGIVKDPRGNPLPNILIEVMDSEGSPVRAFKTNALGHFASATPVANGTYRIEFDDQKGQNKFDTIEIDAKGEIIMPIEVISTDQREELRKSLFN